MWCSIALKYLIFMSCDLVVYSFVDSKLCLTQKGSSHFKMIFKVCFIFFNFVFFPFTFSHSMITVSRHFLHPFSQITEISSVSFVTTHSPIPVMLLLLSFLLAQTHSHHSLLHYSSITLDWNSCLFFKTLHSTSFFQITIHWHFLKLTQIPPFWYILSTHSSLLLGFLFQLFYQSFSPIMISHIKLPHLSWPW